METRDLYKQKYEAKFHEWTAKIDLMKAQAETMTAQTKLDVQPHLDAAQTQFDAAKARVAAIATATDDKFTDLMGEVESAWTHFTAAAAGAYDALNSKDEDEKTPTLVRPTPVTQPEAVTIPTKS